MSTRTKEEIQEIWAATNAPHTKSNRPPRLTKKEKKLKMMVPFIRMMNY